MICGWFILSNPREHTVNSHSKSLFTPLKTDMCGLGKSQSERVILLYHFSWDFNFGDLSGLMIFYTRRYV